MDSIVLPRSIPTIRSRIAPSPSCTAPAFCYEVELVPNDMSMDETEQQKFTAVQSSSAMQCVGSVCIDENQAWQFGAYLMPQWQHIFSIRVQTRHRWALLLHQHADNQFIITRFSLCSLHCTITVSALHYAFTVPLIFVNVLVIMVEIFFG
jgi:hypothetical protein